MKARMRSTVLSRLVARLGTESYKNWVRKHLVYADLSMTFENFVGLAYLYGASILLLTMMTLALFFGFPLLFAVLASVGVFIAVFALFHILLINIADSRSNAAEEALPDILRLTSMNLRSGMTADRALLLSARPEFGIMETEIKNAAKKVISGVPFEDALKGMTDRIKSGTLEKTIRLITEGLRKGGELATLLEQLSDDIVHTKTLKKEIAAQVGMYAIFIFFAAGFGAPLLYSVSTFLIQTMSKISSSVSVQQAPAIGSGLGSIQFKQINIDLNFLLGYELVALFITSLFGSMLMGLLREGTEKAGLKIFPILFGLNMGIFFATRLLLASFLTI